MKRIIALMLAVLMCVFALAACSETKTDTATADSPVAVDTAAGTIKIGGIGPITGPAAIYGSAVKNAAEIAVEEINELGDVQFELKFEDDEHDPEKSVNAYNSLKDWGMQILMGTVTTTPCVAVSTETNNDRIFELTPSASSTDVIGGQEDVDGNITIERKDNVFQMCFTDPNQGIASADYISSQKLGEKVAIIYNNGDAYSTGIYQKFQKEAETLGLEIVSVTTFTDSSANDFTAQLNEAKNAEADLVFLPIYYTPASLILAQANSMGYEPTFFGVDGMDGILTLENFDTTLAEGVMLLTPFNADDEDEKTVNFVTKYKEKFNDIPNQFAADAYDCIYALYEAVKAAGVTADMSNEEICDKMIAQFTSSDFSFNGLTGEGMSWSATGEVSKTPKGMIIKDGAYVGM